MFASTSRARQHQRESPPPSGTDSCYGVRSLNGSVSWEAGSKVRENRLPVDEGESESHSDNEEESTYSAGPGLAPSPTIIPSSPDDTLHPLSHEDDEPLHEHPSEPSSPASFTSMPSYVASVSSVSRTSSPLGSAADFARHVGAGSEDLVLPMLSLPSTSLHMSLRRWEGEMGGNKVVLAGSSAATQKVMRGLGETCELADMGRKGEVGVLRAGRMLAILITGLSGEQIQSRVTDSYKALHGLLNPSPPLGAQDQLAGLVESYAAKSVWAHLVFALDADDGLIKALAPIVPTASADKHMEGLLTLPDEEYEAESSRAPTPSPPRDADPTPMPACESPSYFAAREPSAQPPIEVDPVQFLIRCIDSAALIQQASTTKFIAWRPARTLEPPIPARSLESSITSSDSPASSASDIGGPMPTVARAQGGGEWEAGLSRRVARRKEVLHVHRGRVRRRTSGSPERPPCHPLFPKAAPKTASVGLTGLAESFFNPARTLWEGQRGWTRAAIFCAVAVAVGWGCWAKSR